VRRERKWRPAAISGERPLGDVLARALGDFTPEHPNRPPWHRPTLRGVEVAYTGNVAVVRLDRADRVELHGLDWPSDERDELEPTDWMPVGWAAAPSN
jgi:hypothetical protein